MRSMAALFAPLKVTFLLALLFAATACSDDEPATQPDTGTDAAGDADADDEVAPDVEPDVVPDTDDAGDADADATPFVYEGEYAEATQADLDTILTVEGTTYPVHIRIDELGIPHVLAQSWDDVFFAQGLLHARDRFAQMELFRHATSGRLARLAGALDESTLDDDIFVRMMGFNRVAREIYDELPEGSPEKRAADAYAAGVNAHIALIRAGEADIPGPQSVAINRQTVLDWEPWDGFSIIRYQQFGLSFDADTELRATRNRVAAMAAFSADSEEPARAARAGLLRDLVRFQQADRTYQVPGFGETEKAGTVIGPAWRAPRPETVDAAAHLLESFPRSPFTPRSWQGGSSNSWAVHADRSASGHALIANDPHLSLDSPATFHQIHLVVEPKTEADGPALNAFGVMFPGLPGILIGHNENVAWTLTTASYDYTDAFVETLVHREGETYPRVVHDGEEVELEVISETFEVGLRGDIARTPTIELLWVPHRRGPLALEIVDGDAVIPEGDEAVSFAWRGFWSSNEVGAIVQWMIADSIEDVRENGLDAWVVGTQNLVFADTAGNIFTTGSSYVPARPPEAMDWDPETNPGGNAPWWTLDGSGVHDWLEEPLALELVPHALNPEAGFIVTANNDQTGVTDDNQPLNDYAYIGYDYAIGFRAGRITRLLNGEAGVFEADHDFTLEELGEIQLDVHSGFGERLTPFLLAAAERLLEEYATADTHADLTAVATAHPGAAARVEELHDLLEAWSFAADDGYTPTDGGFVVSSDADELADAAATALFNVWAGFVTQGAFDDELAEVSGFGLGDSDRARAVLWLLENPEETATYDEATGQSILWDDFSTAETLESRDAVIMEALFAADERLAALFVSADTAEWIWGREHYRSFDALVPDTSLLDGTTSLYEWPQPGELATEGFPQPGDNWNVDRCDGGLRGTDYQCGSGPVMRFLVELDPDGVQARSQFPGGQVHDHRSPHFRDLLDDSYLPREWYDVPFHPEEVRDVEGEHVIMGDEGEMGFCTVGGGCLPPS